MVYHGKVAEQLVIAYVGHDSVTPDRYGLRGVGGQSVFGTCGNEMLFSRLSPEDLASVGISDLKSLGLRIGGISLEINEVGIKDRIDSP